ncbi:hypothetical protein D779_1762 [Imhoffiella purpurea]|uniref:Uncharacterized protein n=1 Tax=Imhoffiella purpurea TaxID=1249627 RepID=W9VBY7_9GAMM|nr:hypothetical protein D779_1762 [Imhoffiella purpurea]
MWRGFRASAGQAPLGRRLLGLALALLPLSVRRPVLRLLGITWPRWVRFGVSWLGSYLAVCSVALVVLWSLSLVGPWLCSSSVLSCGVSHVSALP